MLAIIQARLNSSRLPGKMLMDIGDKTLLEKVIEGVSTAKKVTKIVVATSQRETDDALVTLCESIGIEYYRGDLDNVLDRLINTCEYYGYNSFIRINGDSPLISGKVIDDVVSVYEGLSIKSFATNVNPRSFPKGLSVEVLNLSFLKRIYLETDLKSADKEHVTSVIYDKYPNCNNYVSSVDLSALNFCVDESSDYYFIKALFEHIDTSSFIDTLIFGNR